MERRRARARTRAAHKDSGHWFQWRVQELVRSLQQAGSGRGRDRDRERARTAPAPAASLAGRLRQFAQQQPPRLRRLFSSASSASASAPASAPGSPLRRQERHGAGDAPPPDTAPPVLERPATAASVVGGEPAADCAGPEASPPGADPAEARRALTLTPASAPPSRDERTGPQEPAEAAAASAAAAAQPPVPQIQAEVYDGGEPALAMDVTELEAEALAAGESASASIDGEVPSIVLEPASAPTASQDDGTDSPSRAPAKGPSDEEAEAEAEDGAELERRRAQAAPRLSLSLQPEAEAAAAAAHRKSPVTVQEWVDSLPGPVPATRNEEDSEELPIEDGEEALDLGLGAEAGLLYNGCPPVTIVSPSQPCISPTSFGAVSEVRLGRQKEISPGLVRESSVQSDVTSHGSHGSSVDSFLESRKPDPEEVLLNLGFGGPPIAENEVSRIPRRFLQPSKVKGVAIDDFLRYQQDLIENFETGFCGYRGLTGSSHTPPSVIVAKIREKLRSSHSLCASLSQSEEGASSVPGALSLSVPASACASAYAYDGGAPRRRFSRAARRVLRDLPQDSHLSVLTPDNRRFLDNQGRNKSPDVPRKRIVFGERSFTFAGDGDLVEVHPPLSQQSPPQPPPLADMAGRARPRPLLHKDSVLSSATSLSMTSLDSDSDTDEGSYERRHHNPQPLRPPFVPAPQSSQNAETPSQSLHTTGNMTSDSDSSVAQTVPQRPRFSKRISSTSISSWESESPRARFYLSSPTFDSPAASRPVRYESIDEDVEMTFNDTVELSAEGREEQNEKIEKSLDISGGNKELTADTEVDVFDNSSKTDTWIEKINASQMNVEVETDKALEILPPSVSRNVDDIHSVKTDKERLLLRRSSLKRQNRVIDEDLDECENSNSAIKTDVLLTGDTLPVLKFTSHEADNLEENSFEKSENSIEREGSQETLVASPKLECANMDISDIVQPVQSQFLDPSTGVGKCAATHADLETMSQQDEQPSASYLSASPATADESFEMEELMTCDEEANGAPLTLARTRSDSSGFLEGERSPPPQAPPTEAGLSTSDAHTRPPPIGGCVNKFSSCSDESVVHVPSRDLRELLDELAGRGLQMPDSASYACQQMGSEQQVEAVRMALETYSEQLECGSRTKMLDMEGAAEQLRKQIAAELRHVATLLEEQPGSQAAAAITKQVTALLREQTRLCHQLETLTGCNVEAINSALEPSNSTLHCCCESERMLDAVREENRRLERLVEAHSAELAEIRQMLSRLIDRERDSATL
ncbi:uncharacterized protein LOC126355009 isoform X1 [Schistocerca gregaria]|uniref:uncharacterized protein LOC126355009 isoform X1 n=1 Tax=Schistocerca gregaria TaxID=7010 RepID=UPI00211DAE61|nr:uncharacterized protein LOC126355009 isoform X1 [Schistocerca gregaria]